MATTATLNGGATGGLHATSILHTSSEEESHTKNPSTQRQLPDNDNDPSCRVDSNSSFDSGHEDTGGGGHIITPQTRISPPLPPSAEEDEWSSYNTNNNTKHSSSLQYSNYTNVSKEDKEEGGKKRRKQSRPVRIPASELLDNPQGTTAGTANTNIQPSRRPMANEDENDVMEDENDNDENMASDLDDNDNDNDESPHRNSSSSSRQQTFMGKVRRAYQTPLNLSKDTEEDEDENIPSHLHPHLHESLQLQLQQQQFHQQQLQHHLQMQQQQQQLNSSSATPQGDNEKTDLSSGPGTKDLQQQQNRNSNSNPNLSSFSPGLFPLIGSSPFFGFFPSSGQSGQLPASLQQLQNQIQQQQQQQLSANNPQSGTPSSSSSTGSNHHHSNNNNILSSNNNSSNINNNGGGGLTLQNIPPHRIFNPEAYCDLCNKEFCNKYFLKTHKANKHGVYSDIPPNPTAPPGQNSGSGSIIPPTSQSQNQIAMAAAALSISSSPSTPFHSTPAATPANLVCASIPSSIQQQQQQQQQQLLHLTSLGLNPNNQTSKMMSDSENVAALLALENKGGGNSNGSQSASGSRESFCDLCQKEFCNKYFLKRHKAKIHGIPMETSTSSRSSSSGKNANLNSQNTPQSTQFSSNNRPLNFTNGLNPNANSSVNPNTNSENASGRLPLMMMGSELESLGLELVSKHIEDDDDGGIEEGEVGQGGNSNESGQIRSTKDRDRDRERERDREMDDDRDQSRDRDDDGRSPFNKMSSLQQQLNMNMNMKIPLGLPQFPTVGETTCQFCFREFSSKSLLRSHITKKHRLLPTFPPFMLPFHPQGGQQGASGYDESHPDHEQGGGIGMDYSGTMAATHAMMMGLSGSGIGMGSNSAGQDSDMKDEVDYECTQCGRSFQTIYLLRMHKSYFHPDSDDMSDITAAAAAAVTKMEENSDIEESDTPAVLPTPILSDSDNTKIIGGRIPGSKGQGHDSEQEMDNDHDNENEVDEDEEEEEQEEAEATSDSDDLRRLQTMIMELNRVSAANAPHSWSPPLESARSNSSHSRSPAINTNTNLLANNNLISAGSANRDNLNSNTSAASICHICSKEFYSSYFLQQHIQHYHANNNNSPSTNAGVGEGMLKSESPDMQLIASVNKKIMSGEPFDNNNSIPGLHLHHHVKDNKDGKHSGKDSDSIDGSNIGSALTSVLGLSLGNPPSFLTPPSGHKSITTTPISNKGGEPTLPSPSSTSGSNSGKRPSPSLSRSYCTICHKELCNKYFMRTHMLKMHGISIESSTGLGGVTCDICHKELCSKYFLKVHKQNTHGIIEDGPSPPNPSTPGPMGLSLVTGGPTGRSSSSPSDTQGDPSGSLSSALASNQGELVPLLSNNQADLQSRYFCHYTEVCPFCGRRFRSAKWLKTHLLADHGQDGKDRWKAIEKTLQQQQHSASGGGPSPAPQSSSSSSSNRKQPSKPGSSVVDRPGSSHGSKSGHKSSTSKSGSSSLGNQKSSGHHSLSSNGNPGNKCALCGYTTMDMDTMKVHLIKEHASQLAGADVNEASVSSYQEGQRGVVLDPLTLLFQKMEGGTNKMYRCAYCPFTTSLLVYLYAHERTHTGLASSQAQSQQQQPGNQQQSKGSSNDIQQQQQEQERQTGVTFQCPICFHTFQQVETFQQHLIGHQMSGVLAPFSAPSASGRLAFLNNNNSSNNPESPTSLEQQQQAALASLSLPMLNGSMASSGDSLYWALKNSGGPLSSSLGIGLGLQGLGSGDRDREREQQQREDRDREGSSPSMLMDGKQIKTEPRADNSYSPMNMAMSMNINLTGGVNPPQLIPQSSEIRGGSHSAPRSSSGNSNNNISGGGREYSDEDESERLRQENDQNGKRRRNEMVDDEEEMEEDENDESVLLISSVGGKRRRKRGKISSFRCSFCQMTFPSRFDCSSHIEQSHSVPRRIRSNGEGRKKRRNFRCRKCKFQSNRYQKLVVHNRIHHHSSSLLSSSTLLHRGFQLSKDETGRGGSRLLSWNKFNDGDEMRPGACIIPSQRRGTGGSSSVSWNLESLPHGRAIPQQGVLGDYMMQGFLLSCSNDSDDNVNRKEQLSSAEDIMKRSGKGQQTTLSCESPSSDHFNSTMNTRSERQQPGDDDLENDSVDKDILRNPSSESDPSPSATSSTTRQRLVEFENEDGNDDSIHPSKMMTTTSATTSSAKTLSPSSTSREGTTEATIAAPSNENQSKICANSNNTLQQSSDLFVPSVVYLPVREKVSHSLRVSFSLTPTS